MNRWLKNGWRLVVVCAMLLSLIPSALADVSGSSVLHGWDGESYQYVLFGEYDSGSSLPEPILWRVLYATKDRALLVSEYILETRSFDDQSSEWTNSRLKTWLNKTFLSEAFSSRDTYDALANSSELGRVFLLSKGDLLNENYGFSWDEACPDERRLAMGVYDALNAGLWASSANYSTYYTRTAKGSTSLYQVRANGALGEARIDRDNVGIRPAISIYLDQVSFSGGNGTFESPYQ